MLTSNRLRNPFYVPRTDVSNAFNWDQSLSDQLQPFKEQVSKFFDEDFGGLLPTFRGGRMDIDVKETDKGYHLVADIPGVCKQNINILVRNNVLIINAERKCEVNCYFIHL